MLFLTASSGNKYPSSWTSTDVKELFEGKSNGTSNSTISNSTTSPSSSISTPSSGLSHGAVAGIAIGCIAAIVLGAVGVIFTVKRRSRSFKSVDFPNEMASTSSFKPPPRELPVEWGAYVHEIQGSDQDRAEFPGTSAQPPAELSGSKPAVSEISGENSRSGV